MNELSTPHNPPAAPARPRRSSFAIVDWPLGLWSRLENRRRRHKARQQFARIDARTLRDAGISEAQRFILCEL